MKASRSSLFLIELTISILFFALASAACIQLFVKAHLLDQNTQEINQTVIWSQNLAELWNASDADMLLVYNCLCEQYGSKQNGFYMNNDGDAIFFYFDENWEFSDNVTTRIVYHIDFADNGYNAETGLHTAEITFIQNIFDRDGNLSHYETLYTLPLQYHPATRGGYTHE
ncbi:MAG: hypothetical protein K2G20_08090, partial [Lachnospiraceae bacterium]|nr:hypothetical protein [Lachnospiraceae bacterium]